MHEKNFSVHMIAVIQSYKFVILTSIKNAVFSN